MPTDPSIRRTRLLPVSARSGDQASRAERTELAARLAPRGVGGMLDRSLAILRRELGLLFGAGLVVWIPLRVLVVYQLRPNLSPSWLLLAEPATLVLGAVLVSAFAARVVADRLARGRVEARAVLGLAPLELFGLVILAALIGGATMLGTLVFLVGAFVVSWALALAPVVYVLESERGPLTRIPYAMRRSLSLVTGSFGRWLAIFTVVKLIDLLLTGPLSFLDDRGQLLGLAAAHGQDPVLLEAAACLLGAVFLALSAAIGGAVFAGFYFDQRARLEGVDLYLGLARLEEDQRT